MEKEFNSSYNSESERYDGEAKDLELAPGPITPAVGPETEPAPAPEPAPETTAAPPAPSKGPGPIPDGGLQAWLQVIGSWVVLVNTWGLINTYGVFQTYYETQLLSSKSSSDISWIGSLQGALLFMVGALSGPLYDAGYFRHVLAVGLFFIVFGMFMTSICHEYWEVLLAQGIVVGIGMGLTFLPSAAILSQYFAKRRALAIGIASTGSPVGGIIFPIIFSRLEPHIGFGWATRVIAFILLGLNVVPLIFMRTRVPPSGHKRKIVDVAALRSLPFVVFAWSSFFSFLASYVAFFYVQLFSDKHGIASADFSPYFVTLLNVGSIFGRIVPNWFADRAGSLNMLTLCTLASAALVFGWMGVVNLGGLVVFVLLYGAFSGGVVSLTPSVLVGLAPGMHLVGTWMGMAFTLGGVSILIGTPIAGAILGGFSETEWKGTIGYAGAGLTIATLLNALCLYLLRREKGGVRH